MCGFGPGVHIMFNSFPLAPITYHTIFLSFSYTRHRFIYQFQVMQGDLKRFGTKMHGVLNVPQKLGPEWDIRVLDSTQLTWLNDY